MKFSHARESLLTACTVADSAAASRTTMPILTCIKLVAGDGKVIVMGTDNEIGLRYELTADAVETPGVCVLPPDRLLPILKQTSSSPIQFRESDDTVQIKTSSGRFTLTSQDADKFPDVPPIEDDGYVCKVGRAALLDAIARTLPCADKTEATARWAVTGLYFEIAKSGITVAGTDTRRLAVVTLPHEQLSEPSTGLVPQKAANVLLKALSASDDETVTFWIGKNAAVFSCGPVTVHTKLVEGRFPPFRDIIPKKPAIKFSAPREEFANAVLQAAIMKEAETSRVDFKFEGKSVEMVSKSQLGASDVKLDLPDFNGEPVEIAFNPSYLSDCFKVCSGDAVDVEMTDGQNPVVFRDGKDYLHLVMPLTG